jgi:tRNA (cytidine/uridine-2'-O-)-methyltransferase
MVETPAPAAARLRLALFQPDIPQNTGTMLRLAACLGVPVDIIEPAGFPVSDRAFRRAGMDYLDQVEIARHTGFAAFDGWRREGGRRLLLLTTHGDTSHVDFPFRACDIVMVGRESSGAPPAVHAAAEHRLRVPMRPGLRSISVAVVAALVLGEALRVTGQYPPLHAASPCESEAE